MPRKSAAQKAAEEAAAAEEELRQVEQRRLRWGAVVILAVALFASGYALGQSNAEGSRLDRGFAYLEDEIPPIPGDGWYGYEFEEGIPFGEFDRPFPPEFPRRDLACEIVEADGRTLTLVCDGPPVFDRFDDDRSGDAGAPAFLGVGVVDTRRGVVVAELADDSPAARAGIEVDDVIVSVGDRQIDSAEQLADLVASFDPGTEVEVTVRRFDAEVTVTVTLSERR